jgi:hypothetical protein
LRPRVCHACVKSDKRCAIDLKRTIGVSNNWSSFSIRLENSVSFNNGSGATLNRVMGGDGLNAKTLALVENSQNALLALAPSQRESDA